MSYATGIPKMPYFLIFFSRILSLRRTEEPPDLTDEEDALTGIGFCFFVVEFGGAFFCGSRNILFLSPDCA